MPKNTYSDGEQDSKQSLSIKEEIKDLKSKEYISKLKREEIGVVSRHFENKRVESADNFTKSGSKTSGVSTGYQAKRNTDQHTFLLKHAYLRDGDTQVKQDKNDRRDLVTEFVMGPLYKRLLYDNAPEVELVLKMSENKNSKLEDTKLSPQIKAIKKHNRYGSNEIKPKLGEKDLHIRSKFFENFETLGTFSGSKHPKGFMISSSTEGALQLSQIEGFEKVIAASFYLGETDFHAANIGVVKRLDDKGKEHFIAVKIDHGRSATDSFTTEQELRKAAIKSFKIFGYIKANKLLIPFSAQKLKDSIDGMLNLSDDEIRFMIENRTHILSKTQFNFSGIRFTNYINDGTIPETAIATTPDQVANVFIERVAKQKKVMADLSSTLDIIIKSNAPDEVKNGGWFLSLGGLDPIEWAKQNGYKIEGQDPVEWGMKHKMIVSKGNKVLTLKNLDLDNDEHIDIALYEKNDLDLKLLKKISEKITNTNNYFSNNQKARWIKSIQEVHLKKFSENPEAEKIKDMLDKYHYKVLPTIEEIDEEIEENAKFQRSVFIKDSKGEIEETSDTPQSVFIKETTPKRDETLESSKSVIIKDSTDGISKHSESPQSVFINESEDKKDESLESSKSVVIKDSNDETNKQSESRQSMFIKESIDDKEDKASEHLRIEEEHQPNPVQGLFKWVKLNFGKLRNQKSEPNTEFKEKTASKENAQPGFPPKLEKAASENSEASVESSSAGDKSKHSGNPNSLSRSSSTSSEEKKPLGKHTSKILAKDPQSKHL